MVNELNTKQEKIEKKNTDEMSKIVSSLKEAYEKGKN